MLLPIKHEKFEPMIKFSSVYSGDQCGGAGFNRRNERKIGGMKLAGPPCVRPSKTPMVEKFDNNYNWR